VISRADVDRLRRLRSPQSPVISVYLPIPLDQAEHRGLATAARELVKAAASVRQAGEAACVSDTDLAAITNAVATRSHEWLGHTIAIFACADIGLLEFTSLPGHLTERAVVAARPHIRPLLLALQRNPPYLAAVIDAKHAWVLAIGDNEIEIVAERTGKVVPSQGFSGWCGLQAHRVQQRVIQLARQHFRDTITILDRAAQRSRRPLVIGGHESEVHQFLALVPRQVKLNVAGSFRVDLQTLTPARVRELAAPVISRWTELSEARLVDDMLGRPPGTAVMTDLAGCLAAVRMHAVARLVIGDDEVIGGFACDDCGAMTTQLAGCGCEDAGCHAVPDLLDELASRALDDDATVTQVRNPPFTAAAQLRFPVGVEATGEIARPLTGT
jgi:peptide subunit release factor 1 (eRF1)